MRIDERLLPNRAATVARSSASHLSLFATILFGSVLFISRGSTLESIVSPGRRKREPKPATQAAPALLHPNPQFARPGWISLNGSWDFAIDRAQEWAHPQDVKWNS